MSLRVGTELLAYPVALLLVAAAGTLISIGLARRAGYPLGRVVVFFTIIGVVGVLGAKLFSVGMAGSLRSFDEELGQGFRYPGGILAVLVAAPFVSRWLLPSVPRLALADLMTPGIALAIGVFRVECLLRGCCTGDLCFAPWALRFPAGSVVWSQQVLAQQIPAAAVVSLPVHPLQLYLLVLAFAVGAVVLWWLPRRSYPGQVLLVFLALHETGKGLLEFLRVPPAPALRVTSLALGLGACALLVALAFRQRHVSQPAAVAP